MGESHIDFHTWCVILTHAGCGGSGAGGGGERGGGDSRVGEVD